MTFKEWWVSDGVPSTAHLSVRQQGYRLIAEAAWNASRIEALEEAARINEQHSKDTNLKWLMGLADRIRALKEKL